MAPRSRFLTDRPKPDGVYGLDVETHGPALILADEGGEALISAGAFAVVTVRCDLAWANRILNLVTRPGEVRLEGDLLDLVPSARDRAITLE